MSKLRFVELFAGTGGLSEGFIRQGCEPVAFVEQNLDCCKTLATRLMFHQLEKKKQSVIYRDYLKGKISREHLLSYGDKKLLQRVIHKAISRDSLKSILADIDRLKGAGQVDLLLGGPPCQAYSLIGRVRNKYKKNDERLYLYKHYMKILSHLKPKAFVFENVPGLLSINEGALFKKILSDFKERGYCICHQILNSSDFGVLQARERIIVVGTKKSFRLKTQPKPKQSFVVNDLLNDLTVLKAGGKINQYRSEPSSYLKKTSIRQRYDVLTWHEARPHNSRDLEIYEKAIDAWEQKRRLKYHELPANLKTHKNEKSFLDRFKVVAGNEPVCHTMTAHIAKDGHHYIHPDKTQRRSLSVREAARIQSFPDNYFFEGSRTAAFTQIGNAVPPILSQAIAKQLVSAL